MLFMNNLQPSLYQLAHLAAVTIKQTVYFIAFNLYLPSEIILA